jgi:hypothetical protein
VVDDEHIVGDEHHVHLECIDAEVERTGERVELVLRREPARSAMALIVDVDVMRAARDRE